MKFLAACFFLVSASCSGVGLDDLKKPFESTSAKIETEFTNAVARASAEYLKYLDGLSSSLQGKGDLTSTLIVRKEIERFKIEGTMLPVAETPKALTNIRKRFLGLNQGAEKVRNERQLELHTVYLKRLQALQKLLVQQEDIEGAVAVRAEATEKAVRYLKLQQAEQERRRHLATRKPGATTPAFGRSIPLALKRGLIGYYSFDRNERNAIRDRSSGRNDGKPKGVEWIAAGKDGGGLQLDFNSQYIELPKKMMDGLDTLTLSVWVKLPPYSGGKYPSFIGSYVGNPGRNTGIGLSQNSGKLWVELETETGNHVLRTRLDVPWDTWFHAAMVYDGASVTEYINGEAGASASASGKLNPVDGLYIGRHGPSYNPKRSYVGLMDEVMIHNRALSAAEVQQLYRSKK